MLLILPLQAWASAVMLGCAFSHPASVVAMIDVAGHEATMAADAACHETEPASDPTQSPASDSTCTHCAACYLASAGLVPTHDVATPAPAVSRLVSLADDTFTGFIPDSPERPPRPLAA